jgi:hypothetical protein
LQNIDSHDFAAKLGIANTLDMFYAIAQQEAPVKELLAMLRNSADAILLLEHITSLLREQEDVRYRNSRDGAVAVCIWALGKTQPALARILAANALNAPRLWWARKAAIDFFEASTQAPNISRTGSNMIEKGNWQNGDFKTKDVLIIANASADIVSAGRIAVPDTISATGYASTTSTEIPGEMTPYSSRTQNVTKAVDSWSNTPGA